MKDMPLKGIGKIGLFFLVAIIIAFILLKNLEKPFDSQKWRSEPLQRYEMVNDLIESQILKDKSKTIVVQTLGNPDSKSTTEQEVFIYDIGDPPSFFSSQKEYLLIVFKNQHVEQVTLAIE
ncbi:hypothetical protein [Winogradskyella aquimaris]|uniref:DUF4258 domain-containing protein n=1 Tax=Winogradskyella aquimaris TaxID=864074 RepID=A0ABU5ELU9_9FLAO|nr:hypothetical protein [Winogradskyella aquimaris]MDY2585871.1 hypothetical protein [Winogradskyella aquimaris]